MFEQKQSYWYMTGKTFNQSGKNIEVEVVSSIIRLISTTLRTKMAGSLISCSLIIIDK